MEFLTIGTTIAGILSTTARISSTTYQYIATAKNAPQEIRSIATEVDGVHSVLQLLQALLLKFERVSRERTCLISVDQVVLTLSAIVTTLSELHVFVRKLGDNDAMSALDRAMWVVRKKTAAEIATKLQGQKISLTLMLTILTWYV
jgi:hypothetical protein